MTPPLPLPSPPAPQAPRIVINTSWDDGPLEDLRLAPLLARHGIPAIWFLPVHNPQRPCLDAAGVRELASQGEVGSHSFHHVPLGTLPADEVRQELLRSKAWLEDTTGQPVDTLCYPWGHHNAEVARIAAGMFRSARLANIMCMRPPAGFHVDATFHFTYRARTNLVKEVLTHAPMSLKPKLLALVLGRYRLIDVVRVMLEHAESHHGERFFLHLWGHSWEIEKHGLWGEMRDICALLAEHRQHFHPYTAMWPAAAGAH